MRTRVLVCSLLLVACGPSERQSPSSDGADGVDTVDGGPGGPVSVPVDAGPLALTSVYAHSSSHLYRIDPDTLAVDLVGPFGWPAASDQMTDIAIDGYGTMIGISFDRVYQVDPDTGACTYLADLDRSFNGLSFVTAPGPGPDLLLAAALDGSVYLLDPVTGDSTPRGNYGGGMGSSGDLVSVDGFGTAATVSVATGASDRLALVDTEDGSAELVGDTGVSDIWGLGFWADKVFGFASDGRFVLIDVATGQASTIEQSNVEWWGAGVTTQATVVVD